MKQFNILLHDFNRNQVEQHDIMPYLVRTYKECLFKSNWWPSEKAPETFEDYKAFVDHACKYMYWARCEYEWLMLKWPPGQVETLEQCKSYIDSAIKIDGYEQIKMNLEAVTRVFIENAQKYLVS